MINKSLIAFITIFIIVSASTISGFYSENKYIQNDTDISNNSFFDIEQLKSYLDYLWEKSDILVLPHLNWLNQFLLTLMSIFEKPIVLVDSFDLSKLIVDLHFVMKWCIIIFTNADNM